MKFSLDDETLALLESIKASLTPSEELSEAKMSEKDLYAKVDEAWGTDNGKNAGVFYDSPFRVAVKKMGGKFYAASEHDSEVFKGPSLASVMKWANKTYFKGEEVEETSLEEEEMTATDHEGYVKIFDKLKPKQTVHLALKSVMGMGKYTDGEFHPFTVGRKSTSKKTNSVAITVMPEGKKLPAMGKFTLRKRGDKVMAAQGNMAVMIKGMKL